MTGGIRVSSKQVELWGWFQWVTRVYFFQKFHLWGCFSHILSCYFINVEIFIFPSINTGKRTTMIMELTVDVEVSFYLPVEFLAGLVCRKLRLLTDVDPQDCKLFWIGAWGGGGCSVGVRLRNFWGVLTNLGGLVRTICRALVSDGKSSEPWGFA